MSTDVFLPDGGPSTLYTVPAGTCVPCDHKGYLLLPCQRDDPDRLAPDCDTWLSSKPAHGRHTRCDAPGCRFPVKRIPCPHCT